MKTQCYEVFGLALESGVSVPGHHAMPRPVAGECVSLEFGAVPQALKDPDYADGVVAASPTEFLLHIPGIIRLYIERGRRILVEPVEPADTESVWGFILGAGISMVGLQRGLIPLHASSVATDAGCIAFAGQSTGGKSTLAAMLVEQGFALHSDDLCLVHPPRAGRAMVGPGTRELRLRENSTSPSLPPCTESRLAPRDEKLVFRPLHQSRRALPLSRIYLLEFDDELKGAEIAEIRGIAALKELLGVLRLRRGLLSAGRAASAIQLMSAICESVPVFRFARPRNASLIREGSRLLIEHFERPRVAA